MSQTCRPEPVQLEHHTPPPNPVSLIFAATGDQTKRNRMPARAVSSRRLSDKVQSWCRQERHDCDMYSGSCAKLSTIRRRSTPRRSMRKFSALFSYLAASSTRMRRNKSRRDRRIVSERYKTSLLPRHHRRSRPIVKVCKLPSQRTSPCSRIVIEKLSDATSNPRRL